MSHYINYQSAFMLNIIILQTICGVLSILLLKKLKLKHSFSLFSRGSFKRKNHSIFYLTGFVFIIIILNLLSNINAIVYNTSKINLFLYFIAFMSTGFFEELLTRGLVFNTINNKYGQTQKGFYFSIFTTNIIFAITHIVWYIAGLSPLTNSLNQIFFAFVLGVFFNAVYLKFDTIIVPIIFHGLIDVSGSFNFLLITSKDLYVSSLIQEPITIPDFIISSLIILPFLIVAIFILKKLGPKNSNTSI